MLTTNSPVLTHLLLGLCGVLIVLNGVEWAYLNYRIGQSREVLEQPIVADLEFERIGSHDFVLAPKENFAEFVERPLMIEGRRPVADAPEASAVTAPVDQGNLQIKLMGVVTTPVGTTAVLKDSKGAYQRLQVNGTIDGWDVEEIQGDRLILNQGGTRQELKVWKPRPKAPHRELRKKVSQRVKPKPNVPPPQVKQPQQHEALKQNGSE
jgi:hypothetical protein